MAIAIKRILLVTRDVQFAIDCKRALESLGEYAVAAVTEARNAIEQLRRKPHHLVLVDIENLAIAPPVMIDMIRARQSEIAIVLAPDKPEARKLAERFNAQGVVDIPAPTRSLIPVLERALRAIYDALPETVKSPAIDLRDETVEIESLVDDLVGEDPHPTYTLHRLQASYRLLHPDAENIPVDLTPIASQLQSEQDENETIRHLDDEAGALSASSAGEPSQLDIAQYNSNTQDIQQISALKPAHDEDSRSDELALLTLYERSAEEAPADGLDRPSMRNESAKYVSEPHFLRDWLPELDSRDGPEQTTVPADATDGEGADSLSTDTTNQAVDVVDSADLPLPLLRFRCDPQIDRLAATMTRMRSKSTAEALLLTRKRELLAYSGEMDLEEIRALRSAIKGDWSAPPDRSRMRLLTAAGSGREYTLYSKAAVRGLTLSMVFAGSKALGAIGEAGDRMLGALAEAAGEGDGEGSHQHESLQSQHGKMEEQAPTWETEPIAFIWRTPDPAMRFTESVAERLDFWLKVILYKLGWKLRRLDVYEDLAYLLMDAALTESPEQFMRDVMARVERALRSEDDSLTEEFWAGAQLTRLPGREFESRELRDFLQSAAEES